MTDPPEDQTDTETADNPGPPVAVKAARTELPPAPEPPPEAPPEHKNVPKPPHDNSRLDRSKIPVFE